jgi:peptidoglycan/xylan/chitin deacetylase (PgdA/CDA1 family)
MARYITFRFDDGFIVSVRNAATILHPSRASCFIVTGLVSRKIQSNNEDLFRGRDFGTANEWRAIASLGHDIQAHGVSHADFANLNSNQQRAEILDSLAFIGTIHSGPYFFGFPYNSIPDLELAPLGLSAAGFVTRSSGQDVITNSLEGQIDWFRLRSWSLRERHYVKICEQIDRLPDQSWIIVAFHGLDGEGHEPWTSVAFSQFVDFSRSCGFHIVTIREALETLNFNNNLTPN